MTDVSDPLSGPDTDERAAGSDLDLVARLRSGDQAAMGPLFERHHAAALGLARQLTRSEDEAEDVAAAAFDKVQRALENGAGPTEAFRPYLLTAVRRLAWRRREQTDRERTHGDDLDLDTLVGPGDGHGDEDADRALAVEAFTRLPERWQQVLWYSLVEDLRPREIAPILGLSANSVSALAVRAREGLREAYLQVHLAEDVADECRFTVDRLGARVRDNLGARDEARVAEHLASCERCRGLEAELGSVNTLMRSIIGPAVLGVGVADYHTGGSGGAAELSTARSVSFRTAAVVGAAAAVVLTALGLRADLGSERSAAARTTDIAGPDAGSTLDELISGPPSVTPVAASSCPGPVLPLELADGTEIVAAQAVVVDDASGTGELTPTPITAQAASDLPAVASDTIAITTDGICAGTLTGAEEGLGLLLSTTDGSGLLSLALVPDLLDSVVTELEAAIAAAERLAAAEAATPEPDPPVADGSEPPAVPVPVAPAPAPPVPELPVDQLPDARDLLDDLGGGLL